MADNDAEIRYWDEDAGPRWVAMQERLDATFAGLTEAALAVAAAQPGERVLDIGCGGGTTTIALARQVGTEGSVLGVDVSRPLLALAERRREAEGLASVAFARADAAAYAFPPGEADVAFSRFGVMFFADPVAAFANIRTGLRAGGRFVFAAWRRLSDNPFFIVPYLGAKPYLPPLPPADPDAPGQFVFADADKVRRILEEAGFADIAIEPHDSLMPVAPLDTIGRDMEGFGPVSRALGEASPEQRASALAALREALAAHADANGIVRLGGAVWLVSATA